MEFITRWAMTAVVTVSMIALWTVVVIQNFL